MKTFFLTYPWNKKITNQGVVLALGFFDGLHLGHQQLIKDAKKIALKKKLPLMVMTFEQHPQVILNPKKSFRYLSTNNEKEKLLEELGVDYLVFLEFTPEFSKLTPEEFIKNVILKLKAQVIVAGFDYTYGSEKTVANMENLPKFAAGRFEVKMEPKQSYANEKISSSRIKKAILEGDFDLANKLLGHPYELSGEIVHGFRRGHELGFPTANLELKDQKLIPKSGVYATRTLIDNKWYDSMTSVGYNDTFENKELTVETHLFGFDEEAYGKQMTIAWYKYMRGNIKFAGIPELKAQLKKDQENIQNYFERLDKN